MPTAAEVAASKEAQRQEGDARQPMTDAGIREADPHQTPLLDPAEPADDFIPQDNGDDGTQPQRAERPKPIYMSPSDQMRAQIAKRFKRDDEGNVPFNGDVNDPEMLYGKVGRSEPEPQDDPQDPPQPEPQQRQDQQQPEKKFTIKVRGKDVHLTEAELLDRAMKVEAADSYLAESRDLLDQARQVRQGNRERAPADPHRPEDRNNTQDDQTDPSLSADPHRPEDELEGAIEEVRYGTDSKEAAQRLRKVIAKEADNAADQRQIQRLIGQDNTKSTMAMKAFIEANPDLAQNEDDARFMEMKIYDIQREELIKAGIDATKLPKDGETLAKWHQFQRIHGSAVSNPEQMLEKAKQRLQSFKGVSSKSPPQQQRRTDSPRVEVTVDRNARRANLPNQPTRTMAPPAPRQQETAQPHDRSSVINNMRKARGQIVA